MSRAGVLALAGVAGLTIGSCGGDPTGLGGSRGHLALAPRYAHLLSGALVEVAAVRVVLRQPGGGAAVLDTAVNFPAGADSIALSVTVPLDGASALLDLTLAMADAQGDTVFRSGPFQVQVSTNPSNPAVVEPIVTYVGTGANAAGVRFLSPPTTAGFDSTFTLVAEAFDAQNAVIPNTPIGYELVTPADSVKARIADPASGEVVTRTTRGSVAVRAVLLSGQSALHTFEIVPEASALAMVSGDAQTAAAGSPLGAPLVARVIAADFLGVAGRAVSFTVTRGVDTLAVVQDTSDAAGLVSMTPTLGVVPGTYTVVARLVGIAASPVSFSATATTGAATALAFGIEPSNVPPGATMSPAVTVRAVDAVGNTVTNFVGAISVALLNNPLGAGLGGTTNKVAVSGVATFDDLTLAGLGVGLTLQATSSGLSSAVSAPFTITMGPATQLAFLSAPLVAVTSGIGFATTVEARDASGTRDTAYTGLVTLALAANPNGGTLGGSLSVAAVAGVAAFTGLTLDNLGTGYQLTASASGLSDATTLPFPVVAPAGVNAWIGATGNWSVAANWSLGTVPTSADTVWIRQAGTYIVTFDVVASVGRMELGASSGLQTLAIASSLTLLDTVVVGPQGRAILNAPGAVLGGGTLRVEGGLTWNSGQISGSGRIAVGPSGLIEITSAASRNFQGFAIEVAGTALWSGTHTISSGSGATLRVLPSGTMDISASPRIAYVLGGAQPLFDVQGVAVRSAGTDTLLVHGLTVSGSLFVSAGVMEAQSAGTSSGVIAVALGSTLYFRNGAHTLTSTSLVQGDGRVVMGSSGVVTSAGSWALGGTTHLIGGSLDFNGISGVTDSLVLETGRKGGSSTFDVTAGMRWTGGQLSSGGGITRIALGAGLLIDGPLDRELAGHTLEVAGTGVWSGDAALRSGSVGRLRVATGGTLDLQGNATWQYVLGGAQPEFVIDGTVTRSTSTGTMVIVGLSVNGTLDVLSGVLETRFDGTTTGSINVGPAAALHFASGNHALTGTASVTGAGLVSVLSSANVTSLAAIALTGTLRVDGGTLNTNGAGTTAVFELLSGTKGGTATLMATDSLLWSGGSLSGGSGVTGTAATGRLHIVGTTGRSLAAHTLAVGGIGTWSGTHALSSGSVGRIHVAAGGSLDLQGNANWQYVLGGAQPEFVIDGALTRSTSTGTMVIVGLSVNGTLDVLSGVLEARFNGTTTGSINVGPSAALHFTSGSHSLTGTASVTGAGLVSVLSSANVTSLGAIALTGTLRVDGGTLNTNSAGTTTVFELLSGTKGGTATLMATDSLLWSGGSLSGGSGVTGTAATGRLHIVGTTGRSLAAHTLAVGGVGTWSGTHALSSGSSATIRVDSGASLDIQGDPTWNYNLGGAQPRIDVLGSLVRSTSSGTVTVVGLNVSGALNVMSGVLVATFAGSSGGTITVGASGELRFQNGAQSISASGSLAAAGLVTIASSGSGSSAGPWNVTGTMRYAGGSYNLNGATSIARLELNTGTHAGTGLISVTDSLIWNGGTMGGGGGTTRVEVGAGALIQGVTARSLNAHRLTIAGTAVWTDNASLSTGSGAELLVDVGGSLTVLGNPSVNYVLGGAPPALTVNGTLIRATSAGAFAVNQPFVLQGALQLTAGSLALSGGGQLGGPVSLSAGTTLALTGGTYVADADFTGVGTGVTLLSGGTVNGLAPGDTIDFDNLRLQSGALSPAANAVVRVNTVFEWQGGSLSGGGTTLVPDLASVFLTTTAARVLNNHALIIGGSAIWDEAFTLNSGSGAVLRVLPGALLDLAYPAATTASLSYNQGGAQTTLDVQGTLLHTSSGEFTTSAAIAHSGSTLVNAGVFTTSGGANLSGDVVVSGGAEWRIAGGVNVLNAGFLQSGGGTLAFLGGTMGTAVAADTAELTRVVLTGGTVNGPGTIEVTDHLDWNGGTTLNGATLIALDTMLLSGTASRSSNATLLDTRGVTRWAGTVTLNAGSGARIRNAVGADFEVAAPAAYLYSLGGAAAVFENLGTLRFTGSGTTQVTASLVDTLGSLFAVDAPTTLSSSGGARLGGALTIDGTLQTNNTISLKPGAVLDGLGIVRVLGGTFTTDTLSADSARVARLALVNGTLAHEGLLVITDSMSWEGGSITSNLAGLGGTTRIGSGASLAIQSAAGKSYSGTHTLDVVSGASALLAGAGNVSAGSGAVIRVAGLLDMQGTGSLSYVLGGVAPALRIPSGGTLRGTGATPGNVDFAIELDGGTIEVGGSTLRVVRGSVSNFRGTVTSSGGPLVLGGGNFTMTGALSVAGPQGGLDVDAGLLVLGANTLSTLGALTISGSGAINSSNAASVIDVGGNVVITSSAASTVSAGVLQVAGNFTHAAPAVNTAFAATGTHLTRFTAGLAHDVSFNSASSFFNTLELGAPAVPGRLNLLSAVTATQMLDTTASVADTVRSSVGAQLSVGSASLSNTVFDGATLFVTNATAANTLDGLRFQNMDPTATFFRTQRAQGSNLTLLNTTFATTPTTGFYVSIRQTTGTTAPVSLVLPVPVTPSAPAGRYERTTATSQQPNVVWADVTNP